MSSGPATQNSALQADVFCEAGLKRFSVSNSDEACEMRSVWEYEIASEPTSTQRWRGSFSRLSSRFIFDGGAQNNFVDVSRDFILRKLSSEGTGSPTETSEKGGTVLILYVIGNSKVKGNSYAVGIRPLLIQRL